MEKRKGILLLGAVFILVIVVGYASLSWNIDPTSTLPEETIPNNNSTANDNSEPTTPDVTDNNSTASNTTDNTTDVVIPDNNTEPITPEEPSNNDPEPNLPPPDPIPPDGTEVDHEDPNDYVWNVFDVKKITLNTNTISVDSQDGVIVEGTKLTITSAGTYSISGTLYDGQIMVDTNDDGVVRLILDGASISSNTNAPIYVEDADKTIIVLEEGTENYLSDNANNQADAALFSRDNLTICGSGSLTVIANNNDGIRSNDGLIIKSGTITVTSVDDGIFGRDYLVIKGGDITINSVGDGLKSDTKEVLRTGYITIEDGKINVTSTRGDAITALTNLLIKNGTFTLTSGGGSSSSLSDSISTKGLKAGIIITIIDGNFTISSHDDSIHSNDTIIIDNGVFNIASGDDGIHADTLIEINNGEINITQSFEGIESTTVTINNGHIELVSSDDGINVGGGGFFGFGGGWGGGGSGGFEAEDFIYINGGFICIDSGGDGLDADGYIEMNAGVVIINGPEGSVNGIMNAAIDYGEQGSFKMTGGTLVGVGMSGMAVGPSESSTQYSVLINLQRQQSANTLVNIQTASGETVLTFSPKKAYQSVVFSSPELTTGPYNLYLGGSSTGTASCGLYEDGTYSPGSKDTSFTISTIATVVGGGGGFFWGF